METFQIENNEDNSSSDSTIRSEDNKSCFNILTSGKIPIKEQFLITFPKNRNIQDMDTRNGRFLKFAEDWNAEEILAKIPVFRRSKFPNLLGIILEIENIEIPLVEKLPKGRKIDSHHRYPIKNIFEGLAEFTRNCPFILQYTLKNRNSTIIFYKDEHSDQFHSFDDHQDQPNSIRNFHHFLLLFTKEKSENFTSMMVEVLPNVENLCLIWEFLRTLQYPDEFFNKIIIKCASEGTNNQFLTMIGAAFENGARKMNNSVINSITRMYKLNSSEESSEKSILSAAVEDSNTEVIKYLTEECSHLIQQLPFDHQVDISTYAHKHQHLDILCNLVELCDFPFPKEFDDSSVNHERLKNIIRDRQEFHMAIETGTIKNINTLIDKFLSNKIVYNTKNVSALKQAASKENVEIYQHLYTNYGFEISKIENVKKFLKKNKEKLTYLGIENAISSDQCIVSALISKSRVHLMKINMHKYRECHEIIRNWYQQIHEMKFGAVLLKVVSSCKELKIIFDFENKYTNRLDYIDSDDGTIGIALCGFKWIFISAKIQINLR